MNKLLQTAGFTACLVAVLATLGGHWALLQSVAWARMIARNAQHESLPAAVAKALDGRHPCPLCLKIREGRQKEQREGPTLPWLKPGKSPELFCEARPNLVPRAPAAAAEAVPFVPALTAGFIEAPPTPPPRLGML